MRAKSKLFYWYSALTITYILLTVLPAPNHAALIKYHVGATAIRIISLTYIIPQAVIWFAALYAYWRLDAYSKLIRNNKDGKQVTKLARGVYFLAIGLPVTAIFGRILIIIANHHTGFTASSVIIRNYFSLLFPLLAFMWLLAGARGLTSLAKTRQSLRSLHVVAFIATLLGMILCVLIVDARSTLSQTYHMSPELVILTLALPYSYIWYLGIFTVAELHAYSLKVAGIVYRKAWNRLAIGVMAIIILSIMQEYLATLTSWIGHLSLSSVLLLLYVLLLLLTLGYIVLALAAKRLIKIEEV